MMSRDTPKKWNRNELLATKQTILRDLHASNRREFASKWKRILHVAYLNIMNMWLHYSTPPRTAISFI